MIGTLINTLTVLAGSSIGILLKRRLPKGGSSVIFNVVGLFTLYLGLDMAQKTSSPVSLILGLLVGTIIGECMRLEDLMEGSAEKLRKKIGGDSNFVEGMITAFLTFCIGPMTIVGSIRDGMGDPSIILAKAVMDGFASMAYATALGMGVIFSAIPLLLFQGSLTIVGSLSGYLFPSKVIADLTGAGGIILLGLAIRLLKLREIKVGNMLPSLLTVPLISFLLKF